MMNAAPDFSFQSVSVLLPAINETFSFIETVKVILDECSPGDLCEILVIVCQKTTKDTLDSIEKAGQLAQKQGVPFSVLWQRKPYVGGAFQDGFAQAKGSHLLMMSSDLETDPHLVPSFIALAKQYPFDMITASRWLNRNSFAGYSPVKLMLNFFFQKIFSLLYGVKLTDITYAYRLVPTALYTAIRWEELKHPFFLETALKPLRLGIAAHEIPARWTARQEGESQNSFWQTFAYLKIALKARALKRDDILKQPIVISLTPDFCFSDERGSLTQLVHTGYEQINVLHSKAGVFRGGHYHKETSEAFYLVSGAVEVTFQRGSETETRNYRQGDFFQIPPFVVHSMQFAEDTVMVAMYTKCVERQNGSKDIYSADKEDGTQ